MSERRFYPSSRSQTTEAGIGGDLLGNLYISIGEGAPQGGVTVRLWRHPLVSWIWAGALIMALGGLLSLGDRRLRLALPARAPVRVATVEAVA